MSCKIPQPLCSWGIFYGKFKQYEHKGAVTLGKAFLLSKLPS